MEWVVTSSLLILVVLALRAALGGKISAGLRYALWAVVLVRLLIPVSLLTLPAAVPRLPAWEPPEAMREESIYVLPVDSRPLEDSAVHVTEDGALLDPNSFGYARLEDEGQTVTRYAEKISPLELAGWVWAAGSAVLALVLLAANLRFSIRLRRVRRPLEDCGAPIPVYAASALPSPCLTGPLKPAVYVTEEAAGDPTMLRHVLAHELTHYNHLDHVWSVLRGVALAAHWWNPLVWLAVVCSRRDGELACDEGTLKRLGDGERAAYGETLLALVTAKSRPGDLLSFATTMTGGKRSLKERVQRIACEPKTLAGAVVAVVAVAALASVAAFGQARAAGEPDPAPDGEPAPVETQSPDTGGWRSPDIVLTPDGILELGYDLPGGGVEIVRSNPVPAPREWAELDTLDSRREAAALEYLPVIWAEMVNPSDGWLVACYERGVAAADTYVYRTRDGGMNWTEVTMPGTSWHLSAVGFLSPERLIVAQRLFNDAPCFITKDGGESWEEIELPDTMVTALRFDGEDITMYAGPNEHGSTTSAMFSFDLGDTWTTADMTVFQPAAPDLDHDGRPDTLTRRVFDAEGFTFWKLQFTSSGASEPAWEGEADTPHAGWTSYYLCRRDGEDYLLQYTPYMGGGICGYSYKLFYLAADGGEVVVQENSVEFDINFGSAQHQYDPEAINAFMEEINALLAQSELLVNTDENLIKTFRKEGRLYDSLWWLDDIRDDSLDLLHNLRNYAKYAGGYPDGSAGFPEVDLDHDGRPDTLDISTEPDPLGWSYDGTLWTLQCGLSGGGVWEIAGCPSLPGDNAVFLYQMDGEDYLLVYRPYFWHGQGYYEYWLAYYLDGGREVVVQENSVAFDVRFRGGPEDTGFDPEAIAAFMEEVNALLAGSVQLVNTNIYLEQVFAGHGRLYDDLYWLDGKWREGGLTLLESLQNYKSYCGDHPDDAWLPLADLLEGLTAEDIAAAGNKTLLLSLLQGAERGSRFYTWSSYEAAYMGAGAEEVDYSRWEIPLTDGSTLWLLACEERPGVLMIYETTEKVTSAFYTASELRERILTSEIVDDEFDEPEEKDEKEWAEAQTAEYQAVGVAMDGKNYYYQGQLVHVFLDIRPNKSFYTLDMNPAGTVNVKIIRGEGGEITGAAYMTDTEVSELLDDMAQVND